MSRRGRPAPFAYAPLGAGLPNPKRRGKSAGSIGGTATTAERMALLRSMGAGKQRRRKQQKSGKSTPVASVAGRKTQFLKHQKVKKSHRK